MIIRVLLLGIYSGIRMVPDKESPIEDAYTFFYMEQSDETKLFIVWSRAWLRDYSPNNRELIIVVKIIRADDLLVVVWGTVCGRSQVDLPCILCVLKMLCGDSLNLSAEIAYFAIRNIHAFFISNTLISNTFISNTSLIMAYSETRISEDIEN